MLKKSYSLFLILVIIMSLAVFFAACDKTEGDPDPTDKPATTATPEATGDEPDC